ncbi:hypothetical protein SAICODRAFT_72006 [Saitoella complicata NRRL Y-17804]|uniref:Uncharacterized protein n=1 Tax=Saitoella complicata (strain BCRC 22490 / CBS 7301 / JCM 7358 / NBRC 10748 / NRRL Y-17804) TaxID=698492 RepID=A0A0E9NPM9_SAICN|nr:uncharacterized protein SAICODRAFT_72006 [Saitoella complicata NRRL Y-17804]ODQ52059.1 hypothetical protein SAICODRAFT_72006 [Saitoella complicata NRRL Y-17804]GAO51636.1 hypothetical protein G7K_5731-t1 [Saitoella complicata NRRL Y-17804]
MAPDTLVLAPDSDPEDDLSARRHRENMCAQRYKDGHDLFILSASIRGPFPLKDEHHPWRRTAIRVDDLVCASVQEGTGNGSMLSQASSVAATSKKRKRREGTSTPGPADKINQYFSARKKQGVVTGKKMDDTSLATNFASTNGSVGMEAHTPVLPVSDLNARSSSALEGSQTPRAAVINAQYTGVRYPSSPTPVPPVAGDPPSSIQRRTSSPMDLRNMLNSPKPVLAPVEKPRFVDFDALSPVKSRTKQTMIVTKLPTESAKEVVEESNGGVCESAKDTLHVGNSAPVLSAPPQLSPFAPFEGVQELETNTNKDTFVTANEEPASLAPAPTSLRVPSPEKQQSPPSPITRADVNTSSASLADMNTQEELAKAKLSFVEAMRSSTLFPPKPVLDTPTREVGELSLVATPLVEGSGEEVKWGELLGVGSSAPRPTIAETKEKVTQRTPAPTNATNGTGTGEAPLGTLHFDPTPSGPIAETQTPSTPKPANGHANGASLHFRTFTTPTASPAPKPFSALLDSPISYNPTAFLPSNRKGGEGMSRALSQMSQMSAFDVDDAMKGIEGFLEESRWDLGLEVQRALGGDAEKGLFRSLQDAQEEVVLETEDMDD